MRHAAAALLAGVGAGSINPPCRGSVGPDDDDARDVVARLVDAHADRSDYEVAFRIPVANTPEVADLFNAAAAYQPAMMPFTDPRSGTMMLIVYTGTLAGDGLGRTRILTRTLYLGGSESSATSVDLWSRTVRVTIPSIGGNNGVQDTYEPLTVQQEAALRAQRRMSFESMRARAGYLDLARYVGRILAAAEDLDGPWSTGEGLVSIASRSWGLAAEIDRSTGELRRTILTDELGDATLYEFTGRFDETMFPARHPREAREYGLGAFALSGPLVYPDENESDLRRIVLFDSVRRPDTPGDQEFRWQTYAGRVLDRRTNSYIHADGSTSPGPLRAADRMDGRSALITVPSAPGERIGVAQRPRALRNVLLAAGTALVMLAGVVWLRRRLR